MLGPGMGLPRFLLAPATDHPIASTVHTTYFYISLLLKMIKSVPMTFSELFYVLILRLYRGIYHITVHSKCTQPRPYKLTIVDLLLCHVNIF